MRRLLIFPLILLCVIQCMYAAGTVYTVDNLPNVYIENASRHVTDPSGLLSSSDVAEMDRMLLQLEQKTGIQSVVAVVPSIGTAECFDFALNLLTKWGVGEKDRDNGLVILLVTDQRCIQMVTGYGLEGPLPDAICKRIQMQYMVPYLKNEQWGKGLTAGVKAVCGVLDGSMEAKEALSEEDNNFPLIITLILSAIACLALLFNYLFSRCPQCKKRDALRRTHSSTVTLPDGMKKVIDTYTCRFCGHQKTRETVYRDRDNSPPNRGSSSGPVVPPFWGGGGRSSGGGSRGFGGGRFGGGSSGGGGAGTRF